MVSKLSVVDMTEIVKLAKKYDSYHCLVFVTKILNTINSSIDRLSTFMEVVSLEASDEFDGKVYIPLDTDETIKSSVLIKDIILYRKMNVNICDWIRRNAYDRNYKFHRILPVVYDTNMQKLTKWNITQK